MHALLTRYIRLIIEVQLKLKQGDGLSINTESNLFSYARLLADEATLTTSQVVTIVETNHGKVVQALSIEPPVKEIFRPPLKGVVMCHLIDLGSFPFLSDIDVQQAIDDVAILAKYGCLSEPVFLDRRIAVPWANIPFPSERWSMKLLGSQSSEEDMWSLFASLYRLTEDYALGFWDEQANLLDYRKDKLNKIGRVHLSLSCEHFSLKAEQALHTQWAGGRSRLRDNRTFTPILPIQAIHAAVTNDSANGDIVASRPFYLLGKNVTEACFTIKDGFVVDYQAKTGMEALDAFFSIDEGAKRVSEIAIADNDTLESRYLNSSIHPHFSRDITTSVVFGGFSLDTLTTHQDLEDVELSKLNQSLVKLEIPVGNPTLKLTVTDAHGIEHLVLKNGICVE